MRARDVLTLCRLLPSPLVTTWVLSLARDGARREDAAILAAAHAIGERDEARRALAGERTTADAWQNEAERCHASAAGLLAEIETLRSVEASADDEADLLAEAAIEIGRGKVRVAQLEREVAQLKARLDARPAHEGDERIGDVAIGDTFRRVIGPEADRVCEVTELMLGGPTLAGWGRETTERLNDPVLWQRVRAVESVPAFDALNE